MASSNRCSACHKNAGTCFCPGCQAYFCDDHFKDHRGMLVDGLDELTVERNVLQEKINKATSHNESGRSLLSQIDEWERITIEKVKKAAVQARQQARKIMNAKREQVTQQFQTLTQQLILLRDTKGVLEQDLSRLKEKIRQLNDDLQQLSQPPAVELNVQQNDQIVWDRMIYVEEKAVDAVKQQSDSRSSNRQPSAATSVQTALERGQSYLSEAL